MGAQKAIEAPASAATGADTESSKLPDRPEFEHTPAVKKNHKSFYVLASALVVLTMLVGLLAYQYRFGSWHKAVAPVQFAQHVVWKTYSSAVEKASFRYPGNWTITKPFQVSNDANNTDQVGITSPSGAIKISWITDLVGLGGEHSTNYPYHTIIDKTAIAKAPGLYVVSGMTTLDGTSYYPWIAVQDSKGIVSSGVQGNVVTFASHWAINPTTDDLTGILFSTSGARTNQNTPALTKARSLAWFSSAEAQQARTIMLSLIDAANPAADWYLYVSPGFHYSVRLPDGWNLVQDCNEPWSELETYYEGSNDPLALKPGTKAVVNHLCFGKDGNPLISFSWYDFSSPTEDAQKLLDSFGADKNLQQEPSFQTDGGQTVVKYYMQVTTVPQNIGQPQPGTYYEYIIKNNGGFVWVFNYYPPSDPSVVDRHNVVEEAIKTLILK